MKPERANLSVAVAIGICLFLTSCAVDGPSLPGKYTDGPKEVLILRADGTATLQTGAVKRDYRWKLAGQESGCTRLNFEATVGKDEWWPCADKMPWGSVSITSHDDADDVYIKPSS